MVPLRDTDGMLRSLQHIGADGFKQLHEGGRGAGCYHVVGELRNGPITIAEGYAMAATMHELTGLAAVAAFNPGDLLSVAQALRAA